jgi:acetyl esterase/lipase
MRLSLFVLSLLCIAGVQGCTHHANVQVHPGPFTAYKNVVYGSDTVQQAMDVYLPLVRDMKNTPVIIVVHGGGWVQGSKADFTGTGLDTFFTANGCAVMIINYRLDGKYKYPAPVDDIGLVMDYIKSKAAAWHINPDRVCILGRSSGSQLALIYAYTRNQEGRIKAALDFFGPTDLLDSTIAYEPLSQTVAYMLGPLDSNMQSWHDASPLFFTPRAVPTAIFQGTADSTVYFKQSQMLDDSLMAHNVPVVLYSWEGNSHGWWQQRWVECRVSALVWLQRYL